MPVSAKRLNLAGGAILANLIIGLIYGMVFSNPKAAFEGGNFYPGISVGEFIISAAYDWFSFAVYWIVLTTWKRIALAAKPGKTLGLVFDVMIIVAFLESLCGSLAFMDVYFVEVWNKQLAWFASAARIPLAAVLYFALKGIEEAAMPTVNRIRKSIAVFVVSGAILAVFLLSTNTELLVRIYDELDDVILALGLVVVAIFAIASLVLLFSLCTMFLKLARRAEKAEQQQAETPPASA